ncbi:helix-turn-helix transcriptional regulator [Arcanobacterium ihumii]|uniref:helix-turn-helix transcriptional regulator n=1 Tax=Arcanobacterium ihumii TaxID=2138162 RepID=UPI000F51B622|nr:helix-turn-helix transcriptional regulator [Arcanobacterium ihumii]
MDVWLYYYTLGVLLLTIIAGAIVLSTFIVSHKRTYLIGSFICLTYFFDVALVFRTCAYGYDYLFERNGSIYTITGPIESVIYGSLLVGGIWLLFMEYLDLPKPWIGIPIGGFVVGSCGTYFLTRDAQLREFWFFTMRTIWILTLIVFITCYFIAKADKVRKILLRKHFLFLIGFSFLTIGSLLYNVYVIILSNGLLRLPSGHYLLPERNLIENALAIFSFTYFAWRGIGILRLHFDTPPVNVCHDQTRFIKEEASVYAKRYYLSPREEEVLVLLIQGEGNQHIANSLFINQTTVKVHVHNILKKTGLQNRNEVISNFWHTI